MISARVRRMCAATHSASPTAKMPTATSTTSIPSASSGKPNVQPLLSGGGVDANQADHQPDRQRGEPQIRDAPSTAVTATNARIMMAK